MLVGIIEHIGNTDDRSKWIVESTTLSLDDKTFNASSIKVYPNPANNKFTIALKGFNKAEVAIYDLLGKPVYKNSITNTSIQIENASNRFTSGLYLVRVVAEDQKVYHTKLVIK